MKEYKNPVHIEFGRGAIRFLSRFIQGRSTLLITSQGFVKRGVVEQLQRNNPEIVQVISNIQPNPTIEQIVEIRAILNYEKFDVIVALGGGSVIDAAKAISPYKKKEKLELLSLLNNGLSPAVKVKPIISIPTTAGTGSEVTKWGTIWDENNKKKYSIMDERLYCEAAILDVELQLSIPAAITLQTGLDALSHSLESIWNKNSNPTSTLYARRAIEEIVEVLPLLMEDLGNIEYRERMLLASYYAGLAFSNTQTAIAHAISYYLTLEKGIPHGIAASITLPIILEVFLKDSASIKTANFLNEGFEKRLKDLFLGINLSLNLKDYNISNDDIENIRISMESNSRAKNSNVDNLKLFKKLKSQVK